MLHIEEVGLNRNSSTPVDFDGFSYFVVDRDVRKGDRRCDGKALENFFDVGETSITVNNVRESQRVKKRRDREEYAAVTQPQENDASIRVDNRQDITRQETMGNGIPEESECLNPKVQDNEGSGKMDDCLNIPIAPMTLRPPHSGIRCAGRRDTTRLLWLHEFYVVHEGPRRKPVKYIYQALQFLMGSHLPEGEVENMTEKMRSSIWVLGICHIPAAHIREFSPRTKGYIFHTELHDEDARTALFGTCPEVVRVDNCLKWHQMKHVSVEIPRVVHQEDVQIRRVHVAGRADHYVCGVTAVQNKNTRTYRLSRLERSLFCMYPEERLGMELNSPSMMWEHIDDIFTKIRQCMNAGRQGSSSATTSLPVLCTVYQFWQVQHLYTFCLRCVL